MIYHEIDLFLLESILRSKSRISTWILAKKFFNESEENRYLTKKCNLIIKRLNVMKKSGLIVIQKNKNENNYILDKNRVFIKKLKIKGKNLNFLFIKETGNGWQIFEI